ncbi:MAG: tRNA preQ1(34) S-adenosylmethionine ribosyltransferase-isomerase QueA [Anaerolineae bacterium]|nr:tRNA preQ1(34) S-adenosylmethionine ribosyltransferase-isomerase QueA [Anaerolineae bacterium]
MTHPLRTQDYDYHLPADRIAQTPVEPRDSSRLLVLDRASGRRSHHHFYDLPAFLRPGDLLVANDSRVRPARLLGRKLPGGARVELLLLKPVDSVTWETLARGRRLVPGVRLALGNGQVSAEIVGETEAGGRLVRFDAPIEPLLPQIGVTPLPPYIHAPLADPERYQTVYSRVVGSAAAPTAGLHFTPDLIQRLAEMGIGFAFVTLHVGLDTFRPVEVEDARQHVMHSEWAELNAATAEAIAAARAAGGRIVAVGTTAVRVLESAAVASEGIDPGQWVVGGGCPPPSSLPPPPSPYSGWTRLFITPGYRFRAVDALITNFHLPRSTLLMLVSAFASRETMLAAYGEAVAEGYRFFSFGDAMLIL